MDYVVQVGDTMRGIALRWSSNEVKVSDLRAVNHLYGSDCLYNGQKLKIPKTRSKSMPEHHILRSMKTMQLPPIICKEPQVMRSKSVVLDDILPTRVPNLVGDVQGQVLADVNIRKSLLPKLELSMVRHNRGYDWTLLYSLLKDGASIDTLYQKTKKHRRSILIVETTIGEVFGAFAAETWKRSNEYYGSGECFLFTNVPWYKEFQWTCQDTMFMFSNDECIAMGGGGNFGLYLNADLSKGSSKHSNTFDNTPLSNQEDFDIASVEVWGLIPSNTAKRSIY